jgi:hypothetical protein
MRRPYLNFRPSPDQSDEINSIGQEKGLTNADIVRQLCLCGLEHYHKGDFDFKRPTAAGRNKGGPDRRHLRTTGNRIRRSKKEGRSSKALETPNETTRPGLTPAMDVNSNE